MIDLADRQAVTDLFEAAAAALLASPWRAGSIERLPAAGRLVASGDLHDDPAHLEAILALAGLHRSRAHHVVLHEMIHGERLVNGRDFSYRMLGRVAALVLAHPGQVHPVLANHELAQWSGRGVSKGAGDSVQLFNGGLEYAFGEAWPEVAAAIRQFIAAMPLAVASESGLLCAHSLPSAHAMARFDAGVLERELTDADRQGPHGSAYLMVWGRGYTAASVAALAARWSVRLFCVGHEHVESGVELRAGCVIVLNSDHAQARALPIDMARLPEPGQAIMHAVPLASLNRSRR